MIASAARTGSTMLVHLLRSHPSVTSHGEVFGERITGLSGPQWHHRVQDPLVMDELHLIREASPMLFLYKFALDSQGKGVVGFKLKYDELVRDDYTDIRDLVINDTDLKIIFLHRRNLLHRFVSFYVANRVTHITLLRKDEPTPEIIAIELDPKDCERDFMETERRTHQFKDLFSRHRAVDTEYEGLLEAPQQELDKLFDFLGVERRSATTPTKKIVERPMRDIVANYDELAEYFAGGPYARFFDE